MRGDAAAALLSRPGGFEQFAGHDRQFGHLANLPLVPRVGSGDTLAGVRVLQHPNPVPDNATDIELVVENAASTLSVAVDRGCVPDSAARRRDSILVQPVSNGARRPTGDVLLEDPANGLHLGLHDHAPAHFRWDGGITIGEAAADKPVSNPPRLPAADLLSIVITVELADESTKADQDGIDDALIDRPDLDPKEGQTFVDPSEVFHIAGQSVESLDHHDIEGT